MRTFFLIALAASMLTSCGNPKPKEYVERVMLAPPPADIVGVKDMDVAAPSGNPGKAVPDTVKKIIKSGDISFETNNLVETRRKILNSLKKLDGYVAEDNETNDRGSNEQQLVLKVRVPASNLDVLLESVSSDAAKIDSKNISLKDVTTQFIDIKAQLANSKLLEKTYLGLLNKAGKMDDVLQIENKLTEIRTSIDSTQGMLNFLSRQVAYSSLTITFYTRQILQDNGDTLGSQFKTAMGNGWVLLQSLFFGFISLWPFVLLIFFFYFLIRKWRRKRQQKKQQTSA